MRTAQLFLWWTPEGAGFIHLLFSPLNLVCIYYWLISMFSAHDKKILFHLLVILPR